MKIKPFWIEGLTEDQSRKVQETLFEAGYKWSGEYPRKIQETHRGNISCDDVRIYYNPIKDCKKQLTYQDFMNLYGWTDLNSKNPPDLTLEYRFQRLRENGFEDWDIGILEALFYVLRGENIRYQLKTEPDQKPPSHQDIMIKWWKSKDSTGVIWEKVGYYREYGCDKQYVMSLTGPVSRNWFTGKEFSDIPPKEES